MNKYFYVFLSSVLVVVISVGLYVFNTVNNPVKIPPKTSEKIITEDVLKNKKFIWISSELNLNNEVIKPTKNVYSVEFEENGKLKISTDCNSGFGEYEIKDKKIKIGNITSTEKYCPESQEGIFYNELISAESFDLDKDGNLRIDFKIGNISLKEINSTEQVNGVATNPLIGREYKWLRTELKNNKVILPNTVDRFKLTFSEDFKFTVITDCNTNGGVYTLSENNLSFNELVATRMYCEKSQEEVFIRDLQKTSSYEILPDETLILNLVDNLGRIYFR